MLRRVVASAMFATLTGVATIFVVAGESVALAAPGDNEGGAAAAESFFQEGRKFMDAKRYSEACPKFAASQKMAPAIGTLLNLADCYEKNNQLASAWARFHEAIALAQRLGRANREQTAKERADKLEPRLIKLTILAHASGLEVKLDGNALDPSALGAPIPVDAGKHTLEATAKNKKPFSKEIEVSEKKKDPSVDIPPLEDDSNAGGTPKEPKDPKITEPPKEERSAWSTQKTIGVIAAGAGAVGLGVGAFFGLQTSSTWSEAKTHCKGVECDQTGVDLASEAKSSGNISTIAFIAGTALVLGGAVLFFTAPTEAKTTGDLRNPNLKHQNAKPPTSLRIGVGPGSVILGGTFF